MGAYNAEEAWTNGPWLVTWMLEDLSKLPAVTERKLRLFAVACCQRARAHFSSFHWQLVELSERFANGEASREELRDLTFLIAEAGFHFCGFDACMAASGLGKALWGDPEPVRYMPEDADQVAEWCAGYVAGVSPDCDDPPEAYYGEEAAQAALLRDLFGNPFRPVALVPNWRSSDAVELARSIYEERAFDRLPVLGDTLKQAGCRDDDILEHCRHPGPHVRGCWVVDLLTGRS